MVKKKKPPKSSRKTKTVKKNSKDHKCPCGKYASKPGEHKGSCAWRDDKNKNNISKPPQAVGEQNTLVEKSTGNNSSIDTAYAFHLINSSDGPETDLKYIGISDLQRKKLLKGKETLIGKAGGGKYIGKVVIEGDEKRRLIREGEEPEVGRPKIELYIDENGCLVVFSHGDLAFSDDGSVAHVGGDSHLKNKNKWLYRTLYHNKEFTTPILERDERGRKIYWEAEPESLQWRIVTSGVRTSRWALHYFYAAHRKLTSLFKLITTFLPEIHKPLDENSPPRETPKIIEKWRQDMNYTANEIARPKTVFSREFTDRFLKQENPIITFCSPDLTSDNDLEDFKKATRATCQEMGIDEMRIKDIVNSVTTDNAIRLFSSVGRKHFIHEQLKILNSLKVS